MGNLWTILFVACVSILNAAPPEFSFRFTDDNFDRYFRRVHNAKLRSVPDGVLHTLRTRGGHKPTEILAFFELRGDFDIEVEFQDLSIETDGEIASISLQVALNDEEQHRARLARTINKGNKQIEAHVSYTNPGRETEVAVQELPSEMKSGRFRLVRTGTELQFKYSEDGEDYETLKEEFSDADVPLGGVRLAVESAGVGECSVVWKSLTINGERLLYAPQTWRNKERSLYLFTPKTGEVRELLRPIDGGSRLTHPKWHPDGRIYFSCSGGKLVGSRLASIKPDGKNLQNHGTGEWPEVSADGNYLVYPADRGIFLTDKETTFREQLHPRATGAQWAPESERLAYTASERVYVRDMDTGKDRELSDAKSLDSILRLRSHLAWSPNEEYIACRAWMVDYSGAVVLFNVAAGGCKVLAQSAELGTDISWFPEGKTLLLNQQTDDGNRDHLVEIQLDNPDAIQPLPNQPANYTYLEADWSPDGKQIVFSGKPVDLPIEWK